MELILVMALLVIFLAISAPSITRSFSRDALKQEATRLLALTEYARTEAISQGIPMVVWIDPQNQACGVRAKSGFGNGGLPSRTGLESASLLPPGREKEYSLAEGISFELGDARMESDGSMVLTEMEADGSPDLGSVSSIQILDRHARAMELVLSEDRWAYELREGEANL